MGRVLAIIGTISEEGTHAPNTFVVNRLPKCIMNVLLITRTYFKAMQSLQMETVLMLENLKPLIVQTEAELEDFIANLRLGVITIGDKICKIQIVSPTKFSGNCMNLITKKFTRYKVLSSQGKFAFDNVLINNEAHGNCFGESDASSMLVSLPETCCSQFTGRSKFDVVQAEEYCPFEERSETIVSAFDKGFLFTPNDNVETHFACPNRKSPSETSLIQMSNCPVSWESYDEKYIIPGKGQFFESLVSEISKERNALLETPMFIACVVLGCVLAVLALACACFCLCHLNRRYRNALHRASLNMPFGGELLPMQENRGEPARPKKRVTEKFFERAMEAT